LRQPVKFGVALIGVAAAATGGTGEGDGVGGPGGAGGAGAGSMTWSNALDVLPANAPDPE
jgi:hypothetical protein